MLSDLLQKQIEADGPMDIGTYMGLALGHPEYGYYMTRDPLGAEGDFTTAPEVSQMFGEMIGVWVADMWMQMGSPADFILLECGPGRGTLMADLLRATAHVPGLHGALQIHFLEMSPVLCAAQAKTLKGLDPVWHDDLSSVPQGVPLVTLANEFLDALPVRQFEYVQGEWLERVVGFKEGQFNILHSPKGEVEISELPKKPAAGDIWEVSPARVGFMKDLSGRIQTQGGAGLFIDYGHRKSAYGDTLQAVKDHKFVEVLTTPGEIDITAHVDFQALAEVCMVSVTDITTQSAFLRALGIDVRAQSLRQKASGQQAQDIEKALNRLLSSDQMGSLFKVMGVYSDEKCEPAGF